MTVPEHTIVLAHHRGMTVDGIAATLAGCHPFSPLDTHPLPNAIARALEFREEVLRVIRQHRPCAECDECARRPTPSPLGIWRTRPRRGGDVPDMVVEGVRWYLWPRG